MLKNNWETIDFRFAQYFKTKNIMHMSVLLNIIKDYAYPCWENIASSDDTESQITLYLMSHYIMELLCFFINIQNHEELKNIVMESNILDDEVKSYITNKNITILKKIQKIH